jgi:hypothetical protein
MTQEDILRLAKEAGWRVDSEGEVLEGDGWHIQTDIVERFAELVAAAEREECAQIAHNTYEGFGVDAKGVDFVKQQIIRQIKERGQV